MDRLPHDDPLNSPYPPIDNHPSTSPYFSNSKGSYLLHQFADGEQDGTHMNQSPDTATGESVPDYGAFDMFADGPSHTNINPAQYRAMAIDDLFATAGSNRDVTGHSSTAEQYRDVDPALANQTWTSDRGSLDPAWNSNTQSNPHISLAGQYTFDDTTRQRWIDPSYILEGSEQHTNVIREAQLLEARRNELRTHAYDIHCSQSQRTQHLPTDPSVGGFDSIGHIPARLPANLEIHSQASPANINASSSVPQDNITNVDTSSTSPEPSKDLPAGRRTRARPLGRLVNRPIPSDVMEVVDMIRALTPRGVHGMPARKLLKLEDHRTHFTTMGLLRQNSPLMDYFGDTRLFSRRVWIYLADHKTRGG
ncbi:hypothetical protein AMS68_006024 [Peltaster fructicola]|uniref:Uncharacterized protein n=1 Tax=Peltaster fructicola TaxID=286661 RepID=A0A6H0Y0H7_9PEZI|nr:hypothetical protein AMS68_006024 [Peltaster fructicola]